MRPDLLRGLVQPDQRSCGPSSLVAARMMLDDDYAAAVGDDVGAFAHDVLALHRTVTAPIGVTGATQLPWPRALGTPPWAVARTMSAYAGIPYGTAIVAFSDRAGLVARMQSETAAGRPVPFYVGDRWLPRHVVLAVAPTASGVEVYNPARGSVEAMQTTDFEASSLRTFGRWDRPWFVVSPRR